MSQRFDLYLPGDSWLHRLDPRAKLWAVFLAGMAGPAVSADGRAGRSSAPGPPGRCSRPASRWAGSAGCGPGWLPLLVLILILQPLFAPGPGPDLLRLGPLRLTVDGLLEGVSFALRAAALAFVAAVSAADHRLHRNWCRAWSSWACPIPGD